MRQLIFIIMTLGTLHAQDFTNQLMEQYPNFKETSIDHRRFKHSDLLILLEKLPSMGFKVEQAGQSYQGRSINLVSIGRGPYTVLLWSQMHGNEATATMAMLDIFNYLAQSELVHQLLDSLTLYFIPMLNPDGAALFQRRTSQNIDMNRDALLLQCPGSQILKSIQDKIDPDFGFNLHDQNIYYNVGNTSKPATISFLAPAYNQEKEANTQRENAMKVIVAMNEALQNIIPGQVGKYDDTFEPRAFGDNIQKWGTSTILIESGGYAGDPEKQFIRQLNFVAILTALRSIAESGYAKKDIKDYWDIPFNQSNLNDVIIRKVKFNDNDGAAYYSDIAIRREELDNEGYPPIFYRGTIEDLGDLSTQYGYQEIDEEGLVYAQGKTYPEVFTNEQAVIDLGVRDLLKQGYTYFRLKELPAKGKSKVPFGLMSVEGKAPLTPKINGPATFLLLKREKIQYVVSNGFVYH
jgi:hypothetical protein